MAKSYPQERSTAFAGKNLLNAARKSLEDGVDIALFGIPFHGGTWGLEGSRHAPDQVRHRSRYIGELNLATRVAPFEMCRIADIGDAPVDPLNAEFSIEQVTTFCQQVCATGAIPIAIGGDHLISLPMLRGVADVKGPVGIVHFDAHPDTMDTYPGVEGFASRYNSGTPFRRAVEEGLEDPRKHIMIGLRGTTSTNLEPFEWAEDQGMTILWMEECFELGAQGIVKKIHQVIGDSPYYLTIDIDGIDPADMPGAWCPEPCGLRLRDMQVILRGLTGNNLVGADINEINPLLDPSGVTALNSAHLMFEILCLAAGQMAAKT